MVEGGGPGGCRPPGTAAVSKYEIKSVTQHQGVCSRGGSPPDTTAVSKHETGTVTKQTTGALLHGRFCFAGGGVCYTSANISHFHCALGGGRSVPVPARL